MKTTKNACQMNSQTIKLPVLLAACLLIQVVPLTSALREFGSEVRVTADAQNGLVADSSAQCQHIRSVSTERVESVRGNIGTAALAEIRQVLGLILVVD